MTSTRVTVKLSFDELLGKHVTRSHQILTTFSNQSDTFPGNYHRRLQSAKSSHRLQFATSTSAVCHIIVFSLPHHCLQLATPFSAVCHIIVSNDMVTTRISLGLMINGGTLLASSRKLIFGGPVIALGLTGKNLSTVKGEIMKPTRRPSVSLVPETGMF